MKRFSAVALIVAVCLAVPAISFGAGPARGAKQSGKPVFLTPSDLKWVPNPDAPTVMIAVAWGDMKTGSYGAFFKFPAGFVAPLHTHSSNMRIVVVSGTMGMAGEDGKEMTLPAGSYYTQPSTYPHVTKCEAGSACVVYVMSNGKWDIKPVKK